MDIFSFRTEEDNTCITPPPQTCLQTNLTRQSLLETLFPNVSTVSCGQLDLTIGAAENYRAILAHMRFKKGAPPQRE